MNRVITLAVGVLLAAWMSAGRWLFGVGGSLTWWYVPAIGLTYALLHLWLARRMGVTVRNGFRTRRPTILTLVLSWVCALAFGVTVPDLVDGALTSVLSAPSGSGFSVGMSVALCNPFGILAFTLLGISIACAYADGRGPRPEEDELADDEHGSQMAPHPLA